MPKGKFSKKNIVPPGMNIHQYSRWKKKGECGRITTVDECNQPHHDLKPGETPRRPFGDDAKTRSIDCDDFERAKYMQDSKAMELDRPAEYYNNFTHH